MRPAVVTAVLLLVGVLYAVTAKQDEGIPDLCKEEDEDEEGPCEEGWSFIDDKFCAKLVEINETFQGAEDHCKKLDSNLVSPTTEGEMIDLFCLIDRADADIESVWIGVERSKNTFEFVDGTKYEYGWWAETQPDDEGGDEDCVVSNFEAAGLWSDENCSDENYFVCAKK